MLLVFRLDLDMVRTLCNAIYTIFKTEANLPETLEWLYTIQSVPEEKIWDGRPFDYVCLIRFLNRISWHEKHKGLCDAMEVWENGLKNNVYTEAEYIAFCNEMQECSKVMKRVQEIIDVFECHFVKDSSPSGQCLELKYKPYHQYDTTYSKEVVWVSPEGTVVF